MGGGGCVRPRILRASRGVGAISLISCRFTSLAHLKYVHEHPDVLTIAERTTKRAPVRECLDR